MTVQTMMIFVTVCKILNGVHNAEFLKVSYVVSWECVYICSSYIGCCLVSCLLILSRFIFDNAAGFKKVQFGLRISDLLVSPRLNGNKYNQDVIVSFEICYLQTCLSKCAHYFSYHPRSFLFLFSELSVEDLYAMNIKSIS